MNKSNLYTLNDIIARLGYDESTKISYFLNSNME